MRLTLVHPAIGRKPGVNYMRTWQMEPLPIAVLAGLTPPDVAMTFFDDRMEAIDFDKPADLVAIPVETYTAKRAYQIASEDRRPGVPVVIGGFHRPRARGRGWRLVRRRRSAGGGGADLGRGDRRCAPRHAEEPLSRARP